MNKTEIIAAAEAEVEKAESVVKRWLKSAWVWLKSLSFKTKATIVVGVAIASGLMFTLISASHAPNYVTQSEANKMLSERESLIRADMKSLSEHVDTLDAAQHHLDSRLKAVEAKPEPAKITTGSIQKKTVARKPARKPASSSSWFNLP